MTTKNTGWWQRIRQAIAGGRDQDGLYELPRAGRDGLLAEPSKPVMGISDESGSDRPAALIRWPKRDQSISHLQEGYERMLHLMDDIQKHIADQGERSARTCNAIEQLARSMADQPEVARQQTNMLESMLGQLESTSAKTQQFAEAISEIPKVARTQTDTLNHINRQLEMVSEQNIVSTRAMEKLGTTIDGVGQANTTQIDILRHLVLKTSEQSELVQQLIANQNKRFLMLFVITLFLVIVAAVMAIAGFVLP